MPLTQYERVRRHREKRRRMARQDYIAEMMAQIETTFEVKGNQIIVTWDMPPHIEDLLEKYAREHRGVDLDTMLDEFNRQAMAKSIDAPKVKRVGGSNDD